MVALGELRYEAGAARKAHAASAYEAADPEWLERRTGCIASSLLTRLNWCAFSVKDENT